jgi:hypothetical protein
MRITFQEISLRATYRWKENGRVRQTTKKFYQTVSPFNKDGQGFEKTPEQIKREITRERDAWLIAQRLEKESLK